MTAVDSSVLGKILLLQSSLGAAPDETRLAQMLSRALAELPGVSRCVVCIESLVRASSPEDAGPRPPDPVCTRNPDAFFEGSTVDCPLERSDATRRFALRTARREYGATLLEIHDGSALSPYEPFVASTMNLAALHIENARNARALEDLNRTLETRVQKRTKSLHESERKYRRLAENSPAIIFQFMMATDGVFSFPYVSESIQDTAGVSAGAVMQDPSCFFARMHPEDRAWFDESVRQSAETLEPWHGVARFRIAANEIWLEGHSTPERQIDGSVLWDGFFFDVTDRKRAEAERERLASAIEQATEVIVITDTEGIIQYVNPAFGRVTGYTVPEALGRNPRILKSGEQDENFYLEMWNTLTRGETWRGRLVNKKKDGTFYTEEAVISPVRDASGRAVNYVAVKRDVTEELRLEQQLHQAQRVESIGRLAGGVAHDLNNLLSPILGYGEMLQDDLDAGDGHRKLVDQILNAGFRARDLVRQLLAFSRRQTLEVKTVDINEIVVGFEKLLQRTIREDVAIETVLPSVPLFVRADIGQIEQVIMNLAVNAADAMPEGGTLTIETAPADLDERHTRMHQSVEAGRYILLAIRDTGFGMDEKTQENVFEPFFSTKGEAGTGLGLATVYGIVKQHGGHISVQSAPDTGTTFKVYLPLARPSDVVAQPGSKARTDLKGSETILIVEDNDQVRHLAVAVLQRQGYEILVAREGTEALELLETHDGPTHLLLTDVIMPGMNGKDLYREAARKHPDLKVLYMSGYTADVIAHRGVLDEGVRFIQKPFTVNALAAKVRDVLNSPPV